MFVVGSLDTRNGNDPFKVYANAFLAMLRNQHRIAHAYNGIDLVRKNQTVTGIPSGKVARRAGARTRPGLLHFALHV